VTYRPDSKIPMLEKITNLQLYFKLELFLREIQTTHEINIRSFVNLRYILSSITILLRYIANIEA